MRLTLGQVADWIHCEGDFDSQQMVEGYSIDSRTIAVGELFFAVKGERFDGHDYVKTALDNGAVAAVVSTRWLPSDDMDQHRLLRVPESEDCVLQALQKLAHAVRRQWGGRVIGVTGSAGKTTTKEAVAAVLGSRFRVLKSAGNLNNGFGLPLQLLKLEHEHEIAVIEMGMNHAGEIAALARMAEPDWAVVSNVGPVHLEFFPDGLDGVARAKFELIQALPPQGVAVLNFDDAYVKDFGKEMGVRALTYGFGEGADIRATELTELGEEGVRFAVEAQGARATVTLTMLGRHNVLNALAAIGAGLRSGMSLEQCATALAGLRAGDRRGEVLHRNGASIINDCYNSNPAALNAMVEALLAIPAQRHIVIAGEMLELGDEAAALHRACGRHMAQRGVAVIVGVRGVARDLVEAALEARAEATFVHDAQAAGGWMVEHLREGDAVLLKGSRGVKLERALALFLEESLPDKTSPEQNSSAT